MAREQPKVEQKVEHRPFLMNDSRRGARRDSVTRIVLGSDSYTMIHKALTERLMALEAQKDLAFSTDFPANA